MKPTNSSLHSAARWLAAAAVLALAVPALGQVYETRDENGNVIYTDQPPGPDARPMDLPGLSVISPDPAGAPPELPAGEGEEGAEAVTDIRELRRGYRDFRLVSPEPEANLWGTGNEAVAAWETRYALQEGMQVTFVLDGRSMEPTTDSSMVLGDLDRGEHVVYAELRDARGRFVARTDPVTFYVKQHSVNFGPRPQPKPGGGG